eukprot:770255-Prorocentrum_minimum.AAC.1
MGIFSLPFYDWCPLRVLLRWAAALKPVVQRHGTDVKGADADVKGHGADVKGADADVKGWGVD